MRPPPPLLQTRPSPQATPAVAVVGFANCGKTELICKLLTLARQQGLKVAALKHSHKTLEVDQPGKDTWRFRQAGAQAVALAAPGLLQVTHFPPDDPPLAQALAVFPPHLDVILVEGYKRGPLPKFVFVPPGAALEDLAQYQNPLAYISDTALTTDLPVFSRDQAPEILACLRQWLRR